LDPKCAFFIGFRRGESRGDVEHVSSPDPYEDGPRVRERRLRGDDARDRRVLADLEERFTESGYDVRALLVAFVTHESFGYRLAEDVE